MCPGPENRPAFEARGPADDGARLAPALRELARARDVRELAKSACSRARSLVGADGATFALAEGDRVHHAEEDAPDGLWKGRRFPASACISGWAITHRRAAVIEDVSTDDRVPYEVYRPTFVNSLAMVPMIAPAGCPAGEAAPLGAIGAYWRTAHRATRAEMALLETLAEVAGAALEHIRLRQELDRVRAGGEPATGGGTGEARIIRLVGVVAHDLRNPLAAIDGSAALLLRLPGLPGRANRVVTRIRAGVQRTTRLVEQLVDCARIEEHGALPIETRRCRLDKLLAPVVEERRAASGAEVLLKAAPVSAWCDGDRIAQAVGHLVDSAAERGDGEGPVVVRVWSGGDEARISVHDHGPEIPREVRAELFQPFRSQGRPRASRGLGLYIADQILRAHGGRIDLESTRANGTTFTLRFPVEATQR